MDVDTREELAEATALLETAKGPRVRSALADLVTILKAESGAMAMALAEPPKAEPTAVAQAPATAVSAVVPDAVPAAASGSQLPEAEATREPKVAAAPAQRAKVEGGVPAAPRAAELRYTTVDRFSWDQGSYSSPKVSVYVPLEGVGAAKERVSCSFTARGFDLTVKDLAGKSYRLLQNNLDKDIVPGESKILVKKDKVVVKLQKAKASYGSYENWANLAAKKTRKQDKANPQADLMGMMKDMYDDGDDTTKKLIGEAMMKSQQGREDPASSFDDPLSYGGSSSGGSSSSSSSSKRPFGGGAAGSGLGSGLGDLGGLGGALGGGLGGLGGAPPGNFDDGMDDLDLGKDNGDGGWGAGGKDDFGFGSAVPPPQASEPVPAAAEGEEEEEEELTEEEKGGGGEGGSQASAGVADTAAEAEVAEAPEGGLAPLSPLPPPSAGEDGGEGEGMGALPESVNALEALDD